MIARQRKGTSFRGLLNYLHEKPGAQLVAGNMTGETPRDLSSEFGTVRRLRPALSRAVFHMPLRPAPGETLTIDQWQRVAERVVSAMGFEDSPWVAYLHQDAGTPHLHVVASRVTFQGEVVSESHDYYRGMRVCRAIEADYGLRVVPVAPGRSAPPTTEIQVLAKTGESSARAFLQAVILDASAGNPSVTTFLDRLRDRGVDVLPNIASTGRVSGLSYAYDGVVFKGSSLGASYSWRGIQAELGVRYEPERDQAQLLKLRGLASPAAPVPTPEAPATPAGPSPTAERAGAEASRHLDALGGDRFHLLILHPGGERIHRAGWSAEQVRMALPWLKAQNARGAEILVRSADPSLLLLTDVSEAGLSRARAAGFEPAAAIDRGAGRLEVWLRTAEPISVEEKAALAPILARHFDANPRAGSDYGHLAGFTSRPEPPDKRRLYASLRSAAPEAAPRMPEALEQARAHLDERRAVAVAAREIETLEHLPRTAGDPLRLAEAALAAQGRPPMPHGDLAREAEPALLGSRSEYVAALRVPVTPEDYLEREHRVLSAFRALREERFALEAASGLERLPRDLASPDLAAYLDLRARLVLAEDRSAAAVARYAAAPSAATAAARSEALLAVRGIQANLAGLAHRAHLRPTPPDPPPPRRPAKAAAAYGRASRRLDELTVRAAAGQAVAPKAFAAAVRERTSAALRLDSYVVDLRRHLERQLARNEGLLRSASYLETLLAHRPHPELGAACREAFSALAREEGRLRATARALRLATLDQVGRDLERTARALSTRPTRELFGRFEALLRQEAALLPAPSTRRLPPAPAPGPDVLRARAEALARTPSRALFESYQDAARAQAASTSRAELLAARVEHRRAGLALRAAERELGRAQRPSATVLRRWSEALARRELAAAELGQRLTRHPTAVPASLRTLLSRVRAGDRTPETLAHLHRATLEALAQRKVAPSVPPPPRAHGLPARIREHRLTEARLVRLVQRLGTGPPARLAVTDLERLAQAVGRHRAASAALHRSAQGILFRHAGVPPVHAFLAVRPGAQGLSAWAASAARRGATRAVLHSALAQGPISVRGLTSIPLATSGIGLAVSLALRWAARALQALLQDREREGPGR